MTKAFASFFSLTLLTQDFYYWSSVLLVAAKTLFAALTHMALYYLVFQFFELLERVCVAVTKFHPNSINTLKFALTFILQINRVSSIAVNADTLVFRMK